ncbi:MAG: chromosome condensation regulator RCC1 [Actinobacteria bacterium]|uniref:Unannotated protein n=1 Tax=freshwater metagenome TaxID=449393 RepID=A0A6J7QRA3_9ZZZZ|nr:chromosome condensation regulator RCC1 [Actinomycetota bacterium]
MEPTSNPSSLDQPKTGRATKAKRRNISIALAILAVIAIGIAAFVATSGDNKSAKSGAYTSGDPLVWTAVAGQGSGTCALVNSGKVKCWGRNDYGQLGNGTSNIYKNTAVFVSDIPTTTGATATSISSGLYHSCALLSDRQVTCWGLNDSGQLGNDSADLKSLTPVPVSGISTATAISTGTEHSCALLSDGQVKCWGRNDWGQLGNENNIPSNVPVFVSGIPTTTGATAIGISTGKRHSCALLSDGQVKCWGRNIEGQLGDGSYADSKNTAVLVSGIPAVTGGPTAIGISTGAGHSCAVLSDGQIKCWGLNDYGQLGDGTGNNMKRTAVLVSGIPATTGGPTAISISTGAQHSCAVLSDGQVKCWGYNYYGQLGNASKTQSLVPVLVSGIPATPGGPTATSISTGTEHSCALLSDGQVTCWGLNGRGQLGNVTSDNSITPVLVPNP